MPKLVRPTNAVGAAYTKAETAKLLAEMCGTSGWQHVYKPALQRRHDALMRELLSPERDPNRNVASEIAALNLIKGLLKAESEATELLAFLSKLSADGTPA